MKFIVLFALPIVLILFACEKDLYDEHINAEKSLSKISLERFKKETGLIDFDTSIKIEPSHVNSNLRNPDGSYELSDFNIDTSIIKRIVVNEKITYTFQLIPVEFVNDRFFNIIYFYKDGWQNNIVEIKPTTENLIQIMNGNKEVIEGTLKVVYSSYYNTSVNRCGTFNIWVQHCTRTGDCTSGVCDECNLCQTRVELPFCTQDPTILYLDAGPSGGGGSGASSTSNNNDEISTSPILNTTFLDAPPKNPCSELKKFNTNNTIQQTLRILKGQSSGASEHGNYISEATNSVGATYLTFPVIPQNPNNPNEIDISAGFPTGKVKGVMHCHRDPATTGMFPMFSAADFGALYGIAYSHVPVNNTEKDYAEYTVMLSVGSGHYALKFKNFNGDYNAKFNLNISDFKKDLEKDNKLLGHMANSNLLIKAFLKNMDKYFGNEVGLYKATESTNSNGLPVVTGWKEQTLNENGDIVEINCQ